MRRIGIVSVILRCLAVTVSVVCIAFTIVKPLLYAVSLPNEIVLTDTEYASDTPITLTKFLTQKQATKTTVDGNDKKYITVKLLGLIPIKKVLVDTLPIDTVLVGGMPIGIKGDIDGVIVTEDYGAVRCGDIVTGINGNEIHSEDDFTAQTKNKNNVTVSFMRKEKNLTAQVDNPENLAVRGTTNGVGILTFVNPENNNFSALGHQMGDFETGVSVNLRSGCVKAVNTFGIEKTVGRKTGIIKSGLKSSAPTQGSITRGDKFGVCGCLAADSEILRQCKDTMPIATRYNVKAGKATLLTSLTDDTTEEFSCEILKTRFQKKRNDKSMVIRITDADLLKKTGGILHGMSGSPIIQNGHLVGALTHAATSDPAKGYAVYIDFVTL
jgi:stage IV sporulation protein B